MDRESGSLQLQLVEEFEGTLNSLGERHNELIRSNPRMLE